MKKISLLLIVLLSLLAFTSCNITTDETANKSNSANHQEYAEIQNDLNNDPGNTYSIVFDANGGLGTMEPLTVKGGDTIILPKNSYSNSNMGFLGWSYRSGTINELYSDQAEIVMGYSDMLLVAQWEEGFITKWDVKTNKLKFPLSRTGTYDFIINWGDGETDYITSTNGLPYIEHTYKENGIYLVTVTGLLHGFGYSLTYTNGKVDAFIGDNGDGILVDVLNWNSVKLNPDGFQFYGCTGISVFSATDNPDLSSVESMENIFASSRITGGIENWDVSNVKNMKQAFQSIYGWYDDNFIDLANWDVSNVTNMQSMFQSARQSTNIENWNTKNVVNMRSMFLANNYFNCDISNWDVSSVKYFDSMFASAINFDCGGIDISSWNWNIAADATKYCMFDEATKMTKLPSWY